jgi:hypothetical protein
MVSCRFIFNKYYGVEKRAGITPNEVRPVPDIKKPSFNGGDLIYFEVVKYSENMGKY